MLGVVNGTNWIVEKRFLKVIRVADQFHVHKLVCDAAQERRIHLRREAVKQRIMKTITRLNRKMKNIYHQPIKMEIL